jgi:MOSC domain-containing protein YiiM
MATLDGIAYRDEKRAPMQLLDECEITLEMGVHTDSRGKPGHRQVTLLSADVWSRVCTELDAKLPWTTRRANLLVSGATFGPDDVGKQVRIGEVVLEITGEIAPCGRMDEQHSGLTAALVTDWRGGACCRVLSPGRIAVGNTVDMLTGS